MRFSNEQFMLGRRHGAMPTYSPMDWSKAECGGKHPQKPTSKAISINNTGLGVRNISKAMRRLRIRKTYCLRRGFESISLLSLDGY